MKTGFRLAAPVAVVLWASIALISPAAPALADDGDYICAVYFTGIGCNHCAMSSPLVMEELPGDYPNLIVVEYEIYGREENTMVFDGYLSHYDMEYTIPAVIFTPDTKLTGHTTIIGEMREVIEGLETNPFPLIDGSDRDFADLDIANLPAYPAIWRQDRVLIKEGPGGDNDLLKSLLTSDSPAELLRDADYTTITEPGIEIPGKEIDFEHSVRIDNWVFYWNGEAIPPPITGPTEPTEPGQTEPTEPSGPTEPSEPVEPAQPTEPTEPTEPIEPSEPVEPEPSNITTAKVLSLAIADAVNPCAFAVLLLMLVSIMAYNPGNRKSILLAGAAFIGSIFVMYFLYGLVFVKFFQAIQGWAAVRFWIFRVLAVAAIVFGALNIRDFARYKPGGIGTEMPLFLRPRVKKILNGITSVKGALVTGVFVTLFLLPCTIGPYIIAAGLLSVQGIMETIPTLLLYNLIFIVPLIIIVISVYLGTRRVHDFYKWKEKNINKMHLVAGILILGLGIYMLLESLGVAVLWGMAA